MDAPPSDAALPPEPPAYVYAASDIRPRQAREIELCTKAASFDWLYPTTFAVGTVGSVLVDTQVLKQEEQPGVRLLGPSAVGFFWGAFLSGGYLALPKCDPLWAYGAPPEGDVRSPVPMAIAIALVAGATAPFIDFVFIGQPKQEWQDWERASRLFLAAGTGIAGALFPYAFPPRPWAAQREIQKIRLAPTAGGAFASYTLAF